MRNLQQYNHTYPSAQNAVDLFKDEWSSALPNYDAGTINLFDDGRIKWANKMLAGFRDKTVLELGPLEGAHSYQMEKLGAKKIIAIEANARAYLKCLITKEIYQLKNTSCLHGDALKYVRETAETFHICVCIGILYHMVHPVALLEGISRCAPCIILWTHYYDRDILRKKDMYKRFSKPKNHMYADHEYALAKYSYRRALKKRSFRGGAQKYAHWMVKEDIIAFLKKFGYTHIEVGDDNPNHKSGPAILLIARK